jgi:flavodoxin short chain
MKKALIVYGSSTGNTEFVAETIESFLSEDGYEVTLTDVSNTDIDIFDNSYDIYLLGCSTWGEDEIELQEDFEPFYEDMTGSLSLKKKSLAVFGCGDSAYTYFCGAVDLLEERVRKLGGSLVCDSLRIDGEPEEEQINEWVQGVTNAP